MLNALGDDDTQTLAFYPEFYSRYVQLVKVYNIRKPTTTL